MTVAGAFGFAMGYVVGLQIDVSATKNPLSGNGLDANNKKIFLGNLSSNS